ncbi:hypothetical protein K438DRAFT_655486 [Mycena galopus ATCC 62051]|nr:hypothetical protein K438DRAFT_655486 [Mycena galopus ATCC 62051]
MKLGLFLLLTLRVPAPCDSVAELSRTTCGPTLRLSMSSQPSFHVRFTVDIVGRALHSFDPYLVYVPRSPAPPSSVTSSQYFRFPRDTDSVVEGRNSEEKVELPWALRHILHACNSQYQIIRQAVYPTALFIAWFDTNLLRISHRRSVIELHAEDTRQSFNFGAHSLS